MLEQDEILLVLEEAVHLVLVELVKDSLGFLGQFVDDLLSVLRQLSALLLL